MKLVTIEEGGGLWISNKLRVTVLAIMREKVRLGFTLRDNGLSEPSDNDVLSEIHGTGWSYTHFSCSGVRMLVLESPKFKWVDILQSKQLIIVDVRWAGATMALCSSSERDSFDSNWFCRLTSVFFFSKQDVGFSKKTHTVGA